MPKRLAELTLTNAVDHLWEARVYRGEGTFDLSIKQGHPQRWNLAKEVPAGQFETAEGVVKYARQRASQRCPGYEVVSDTLDSLAHKGSPTSAIPDCYTPAVTHQDAGGKSLERCPACPMRFQCGPGAATREENTQTRLIEKLVDQLPVVKAPELEIPEVLEEDEGSFLSRLRGKVQKLHGKLEPESELETVLPLVAEDSDLTAKNLEGKQIGWEAPFAKKKVKRPLKKMPKVTISS